MASGSTPQPRHPAGVTEGGQFRAPDPWPPPEIAAQLNQPSPHDPWPPPDLDAALELGEGVTQLEPAPTAQEAGAVSPAVLRSRYGASAAQGGRGDGDPGSP